MDFRQKPTYTVLGCAGIIGIPLLELAVFLLLCLVVNPSKTIDFLAPIAIPFWNFLKPFASGLELV